MSDIMSAAMAFDAPKFVVGLFIMFVYASLMLGPMDRVENMFCLAAAGVASAMMGVLIAMGVASVVGLPYTMLHAVVAYLTLGKLNLEIVPQDLTIFMQ